MQLSEWLVWIVGGGGAGVITYWIMEHLKLDLEPEAKRYIVLLLSALLACVGFAASVGLGYRISPAGWQGWLEQLFTVVFAAFTSSQVVHARLKLGA